MGKKLECDIISFSHDHYVVFKNGKYHITNQPHYYGDLEFKFDDSELKRIKYVSKEDKIKDICLKTNLSPEEILERCNEGIEDFYKKNTSKFISKILGDSMVNRFAKVFYNKSYKNKKEGEKIVKCAIKTKTPDIYNDYGSYLSIDFYNKHIKVLINFKVLKNSIDEKIESYILDKERYIQEGWMWSEDKIEDIKKSYQNILFDYRNLINISSIYDIKLNFILNSIKECVFSCEFKEISD